MGSKLVYATSLQVDAGYFVISSQVLSVFLQVVLGLIPFMRRFGDGGRLLLPLVSKEHRKKIQSLVRRRWLYW